MAGPWEQFQTQEQGPWSQFTQAAPPPPEKQSAFRQVADIPVGIAKGAVQGVRMIADVFGAGSDTSNAIRGAENYLADLMSAQAKNDQQEIARIMKEAEDKGVLDQVKAGVKAFTVAPIDTLSSALGTAAPVIAAGLGSTVLGAPALVSTGVGALMGAGMGAGTVKGSIYDETKKALKDAGAAEEEAERRAQLAQEYGGKNLDQILLGTVIGGAAAVGPLEKGGAAILARRILGKTAVEGTETVAGEAAKGALRRRAEAGLLEAAPEALQAGQEQVAQNIALQREGFDVPTFRGAAGAATLEGLAGAGLGATIGGGKPEVSPTPEISAPAEPVALPPQTQQAPRSGLPDTEVGGAPEQVLPRVEEVTGVSRQGAPSAQESAETLARLYQQQDAEGRAYAELATQKRLIQQQQAIDEDAERIAELNRRQGLPPTELPRAPIVERPSMAEAAPELTSPEELLAKQAGVDRRRLEAGLPTGESSVTPGVQPEVPVAEEPKPVPKLVDNRPLQERAAQNRLLVMRNMLQNQGGDPESLTIVPHPTAAGKFAIQSLDVPVKFTKELPRTAITRPETPVVIDPVNAYVEVQRRTNTPAARRFVQDFEAGKITPAEVQQAIEQEQKAAQPQPLTYTATGAPGIIAPEVSKPRGEREVPKLGEAPPKIATPEEPPVVEVPGEEPPTPESTLPQNLQEFEARMPIVFDKPEVRQANVEGNFTKLTQALQLSTNPAIRRIGQLGSGIASKITLRKPGSLGKNVAGVYRYDDDSIQMIRTHAGNEHTNAHETLHALLSKAQRYPTERQKPIVAQIEKLYEYVKKELKRKGVTAYGLTNPREFTAEAMTNPAFQYELMQIPYAGKKSAWTQFVRLVADLLGIQNTNALTEVMNLVDRLAMQKQPRRPITEKGLTDEAIVDESTTVVEEAPASPDQYLLSVEPTIKSDRMPSYKRGVENLRKRLDKGELTSDAFAARVGILARQIEIAELAKEKAGRERGADFLRQRLLEAKRRGELSAEAVDFAEWFILQNSKLVDDLGISIRTSKEEGVGGMYSAYARVMYLMKERGSDTTVVHEILHHLERMMPKEVQAAIRKTWIKSLVEAQKNATAEADKKFFKNLTDFHFGFGSQSLLKSATDAIKEGDVSKDLYQYTSPSEFWAENASEIMKGRFDVKGSVLGKLKQWLSELKEKARSLFGLENKAAIIRALDSLSKGDGKFVSTNLLDDSKETRQVVKEVRKSGEDRATANFLRWFGDSKVVDEKGEPLVVYHGTPKVGFTEFGMNNVGAFFSDRFDVAASYAGRYNEVEFDEEGAYADDMQGVYDAYLSLKNPLVVDWKGNDWGAGPEGLKLDDWAVRAKRQGHDGLIVENVVDTGYLSSGIVSDNGLGTVYVAFRPEQIKSAIGNNGDYSLTNADIRKSIGGVNPGRQALDTVNRLGMGVKPPEPSKFEKAKKLAKEAGENPAATKESAKKALTKWLDWFETTVFSGDAAYDNNLRREVIDDMKSQPEVLGLLLEASQSQAVNADNVVSRGIIDGTVEYNKDVKKWESVKKDENFKALAKKIDNLSKKYGVSKEEMERIAHTYFVTKRLPGIVQRNNDLEAAIAAEEKTAKPDRKQIDKWKSLLVYVSPEQMAQIEPGLSLVKNIPELSELVDIWQGIRKNVIGALVDSGLWTEEYATNMFDNIDYVPYYREEQLEEGAGPMEFIRGLQVKSKEFQLKGSGAAVNDVFDNMIRWSQYALNRSIRAHKARQMIDAIKDIDAGDRKMATQVTEEKRGMNIVRIFRDGKQEIYDVADPMIVPAFSAIQNVSIPMFKWAARVADVLRNSVVLYPMFSVAQVPQDSFAAMFTSGLKPQHALKIPILAVKEFIKTLNKTSATHNELVKYGVVGARDFSADVMRKDAEIYAGVRPPKGGWGKTKEFLEHIAMSADNAVRQAVYEAATQQGMSKAEALEKAFEIFNVRRRGTSKALNLAGQTIPFFYAYLAAQRVAYRTITGVGTSPTERKAALQTLAATSASVFTLAMLYAMMVSDDEDYAETPAAVRDRTLTIPGSGGVRIPLRPDFFLFPKIVAEHTYLMLTDKGYEDGAKFRTSIKDALINAISSPTPMPQVVKPVLEVAINYDFFQGKPVIGQFEKQKEMERQFNDSTSELSKLLGKTGFVSPIAADHLIRGMFGSAGGLVLYATNFLNSDPDVPRPELSWKEAAAALPGTSGFLKRPQESALKNDFYVLRDEVEKAVNTFNDIKLRSPEGIEAFLADEKNMARLMLGKPVDQISRQLAKIRKAMTVITNMPENQMSGADKADYKRQLMEMERDILRSVDVKALREMAKI